MSKKKNELSTAVNCSGRLIKNAMQYLDENYKGNKEVLYALAGMKESGDENKLKVIHGYYESLEDLWDTMLISKTFEQAIETSSRISVEYAFKGEDGKFLYGGMPIAAVRNCQGYGKLTCMSLMYLYIANVLDRKEIHSSIDTSSIRNWSNAFITFGTSYSIKASNDIMSYFDGEYDVKGSIPFGNEIALLSNLIRNNKIGKIKGFINVGYGKMGECYSMSPVYGDIKTCLDDLSAITYFPADDRSFHRFGIKYIHYSDDNKEVLTTFSAQSMCNLTSSDDLIISLESDILGMDYIPSELSNEIDAVKYDYQKRVEHNPEWAAYYNDCNEYSQVVKGLSDKYKPISDKMFGHMYCMFIQNGDEYTAITPVFKSISYVFKCLEEMGNTPQFDHYNLMFSTFIKMDGTILVDYEAYTSDKSFTKALALMKKRINEMNFNDIDPCNTEYSVEDTCSGDQVYYLIGTTCENNSSMNSTIIMSSPDKAVIVGAFGSGAFADIIKERFDSISIGIGKPGIVSMQFVLWRRGIGGEADLAYHILGAVEDSGVSFSGIDVSELFELTNDITCLIYR